MFTEVFSKFSKVNEGMWRNNNVDMMSETPLYSVSGISSKVSMLTASIQRLCSFSWETCEWRVTTYFHTRFHRPPSEFNFDPTKTSFTASLTHRKTAQTKQIKTKSNVTNPSCLSFHNHLCFVPRKSSNHRMRCCDVLTLHTVLTHCWCHTILQGH